MKVFYICGYYSDLAARASPRPDQYWHAHFFVWAVKKGSHKRNFAIRKKAGRIAITKENFHLVRQTFGEWAAQVVSQFSQEPLLLIPVPSKDALTKATTYQSLEMAQEAFKSTTYVDCVFDGLRWNKKLPKVHEGGPRKRADLLPLLDVRPGVEGKQIVLIDDVVTTGGSLLACHDRLNAAGAKVLGAVTCGRTIYDLDTPPFGSHSFELTEELSDYRG